MDMYKAPAPSSKLVVAFLIVAVVVLIYFLVR